MEPPPSPLFPAFLREMHIFRVVGGLSVLLYHRQTVRAAPSPLLSATATAVVLLSSRDRRCGGLVCRRCVTTAEGQAFADKHGLLFMEMSARNAAQVEKAFIGTAERVSKRVIDVHAEAPRNREVLLPCTVFVFSFCVFLHGTGSGVFVGVIYCYGHLKTLA